MRQRNTIHQYLWSERATGTWYILLREMIYGSGIILLQVMVEVMEHRLNLLKRKEEVLLKGQVTHLLKRGRLQLGGITMAPLVMKGEDIGITLRRRGAKLQEEDHTIRYMYLQGDNKLTDQQKNIPVMKE
jgi:hypothetical protein